MSFSLRRDLITRPIDAWAHKALPPIYRKRSDARQPDIKQPDVKQTSPDRAAS